MYIHYIIQRTKSLIIINLLLLENVNTYIQYKGHCKTITKTINYFIKTINLFKLLNNS